VTDVGMPWGWLWAVAAVAAGGAAGAVVRHVLAVGPWGPLRGILVANTAGSAALGAVVALVDDPVLLLLLGTGVCGALTTWSTLAVQTTDLARRAPWRAAAYLGLTVGLGLAVALLTLRLLG
jgi:fluoride exporter